MENVKIKRRKKKKKKSRVDVEDTALAPRADAGAEEDDEEDYDETISLEAGAGGERGELIDIEFSFNDPSETDFHSVRNLVRRSFFASILNTPGGKGKASAADVAVALDANVSSLADSIVGQLECCSVVQAVKDEDEDDEEEEASGGASSSSAATAGGVAASVPSAGDGGTFGVILALPLALAKLQSCEWLGALRACLLGKAPAAARDVLETLLAGRAASGGTAALLVSIRLVNLPNELVPHMYDALCQDVAWVRENAVLAEHDAAAQKAFRFTQYVFLAPCTARGGADGSTDTSAGGAPKRKKQKRAGGAGGSALQFERFEVQALYKAATVKFDFALAKPSPLGAGAGAGAGGAESGPPAGPPRRLAVMVLPASAVQKRALPWMRTTVASSVAGR
jgi:hypothetical protein